MIKNLTKQNKHKQRMITVRFEKMDLTSDKLENKAQAK